MARVKQNTVRLYRQPYGITPLLNAVSRGSCAVEDGRETEEGSAQQDPKQEENSITCKTHGQRPPT